MLWVVVAGIFALVSTSLSVVQKQRTRAPFKARPEAPAATENETPASRWLDALELVKAVVLPEPLPFVFSVHDKPRKAKQAAVTEVFCTVRTSENLITGFQVIAGANIPHTTFKVDAVERKEVINADGTTKDVSEITVVNAVTREKRVVPLGRVSYPISYAVFHYKRVQAGVQPTPVFTTRLDQTFTLPPKRDTTYKVIAITEQRVVIEVPDGTKKTLLVPK